MRKNLLSVGVSALLSLSAMSCGDSSTEPTDTQITNSYFPLEVGNYWEYEVSDSKRMYNGKDTTFMQYRKITGTEVIEGQTFYIMSIWLQNKTIADAQISKCVYSNDTLKIRDYDRGAPILYLEGWTIFSSPVGERTNYGIGVFDSTYKDNTSFFGDSKQYIQSKGDAVQTGIGKFKNTVTIHRNVESDSSVAVYAMNVGCLYNTPSSPNGLPIRLKKAIIHGQEVKGE